MTVFLVSLLSHVSERFFQNHHHFFLYYYFLVNVKYRVTEDLLSSVSSLTHPVYL